MTARDTTADELGKLQLISWQEWCKRMIDLNTTQLWREIRKLRGSPPAPPPRDFRNKTEEPNRDFTTRASIDSLPEHVRQEFLLYEEERHIQLQESKNQPATTDRPFTTQELQNVLNQTKNTSPGEDNIPYTFYKKAGSSFQHRLLRLLNRVWTQGYIPQEWRRAKIIPIPKPGRSTYRPISRFSRSRELNDFPY